LPPNPDVNHWRTSQENTRNYGTLYCIYN
jgi:hypothetical protein